MAVADVSPATRSGAPHGRRSRVAGPDLGATAVLASFIISTVLSLLGRAWVGFAVLGFIYSLAVLVPSIAVGIRRLHDTGRTGWWILIGLVPLVGFIVLIVFFATQGNPGPNQYGAPPPNEPVLA